MAQGVSPPSLGWGCPCPQEGDGSKVTVAVSPQEPSLYTVKAVIILDNDGDRLFAKVRGGGGDGDKQGAGMGTLSWEDGGDRGAQVWGRLVALGGLGRNTGQGHGGRGGHLGVVHGMDKGMFGGTRQGWGHGDRVGGPEQGWGGAPRDLGGVAQVPTCHCPCSTMMTRTPALRSRKPSRRTSSTRPTAPTVRILGTGTCVFPGRGRGGAATPMGTVVSCRE